MGTALGAIALVVALAALALNFVGPGHAGPAGAQGSPGTPGGSLYAVVSSTGGLVHGSQAVSSEETSTGVYQVIFNQNVASCDYQANLGTPTAVVPSPGWISVGGLAGNPNGVYVRTTGLTGTLSNSGFDLVVLCSSGLWAVIGPTGSVVRGDGVVTAAQNSTGAYNVVFNEDVAGCAFLATLGTVGSSGFAGPGVATVAGAHGVPNGVFVSTYNATGATTNSSFDLAVVCTSNAWAVIASGGASARGNLNWSSTYSTGFSQVIFFQDVTNCAYIVTPGLTTSTGTQAAAFAGVAPRANAHNGVFIITTGVTGTDTDEPFHIAAFC
jgi:hypothetical protein